MMKAEEIVRLSRRGVSSLLTAREQSTEPHLGHERRRKPRWPFPGTIELCVPGEEALIPRFGTCHDLSEEGVGFTCDEAFEPGTTLDIALHLPEASFYGRGTIRHRVRTPRGYLTGMEFLFED